MIKLGDKLLCIKNHFHPRNGRILFKKDKFYRIYAIDESDGDIHAYSEQNTTMIFIRKKSTRTICNHCNDTPAPKFGKYFKCREGKLRALIG